MSSNSSEHEEGRGSKLKETGVWVIRLLPILPWLSYEIIAWINQTAKNAKPATGVLNGLAKGIGYIVGFLITLVLSIPALIYEYLLQPIASIYWCAVIIYFVALTIWLLKKPSNSTTH
jgi:uncharacterized protein YacL